MSELLPCPFCKFTAKIVAVKYAKCTNIHCAISRALVPLQSWNTRATPQWISVDDRLPVVNEESQSSDEVLIYCRLFDQPQGCIYVGFHSHNPSGWWNDEGTVELFNITHWQPLPTPPPPEVSDE